MSEDFTEKLGSKIIGVQGTTGWIKEVKKRYANEINELAAIEPRDKVHARLLSEAMMKLADAQMWELKAMTYRGNE